MFCFRSGVACHRTHHRGRTPPANRSEPDQVEEEKAFSPGRQGSAFTVCEIYDTWPDRSGKLRVAVGVMLCRARGRYKPPAVGGLGLLAGGAGDRAESPGAWVGRRQG